MAHAGPGPGPVERLLWLLPAAATGGLVGLVSVPVSRMTDLVAGVRVPWGLVLAVVATVAVVVLAELLTGTAVATAAVSVGWFAAVGYGLFGRPEGDYLLPGDPRGWTFLALAGGVLAVALGRAMGSRPRAPQDPARS